MENRWSSRKGLRLGVDVCYGDKISSCRSKDIAMGGTYLEFNSQTEFDQFINVELIFYLERSAGEIKYALPAQVVRVERQGKQYGIGLKFHNFDTSVFRTLQELLSYQES